MKNFVIFDIETTGLDKLKDQIIQFAGIKVNPENHRIIDSKNIWIQPVGNYQMSLGAYFKHGIKPEQLKDKPYFSEVAQEILDFFKDCDVITYNGNSFDIPFLLAEFNKVGIDYTFTTTNCYDAFLEEKRRNGNRLAETYQRYKGKSMEEAGLVNHDALSDVKATYSVFVAQQRIKHYEPEQMFGDDNVITNQEFQDKIQPCFNIGKYKGISLELVNQIDKGYLAWTLSDSCNFSNTTKEFIKSFIKNKIN